MDKLKKYVIRQDRDREGKLFWYCHLEGYPYIPVFGSIGTKSKATKVMKQMNGVG